MKHGVSNGDSSSASGLQGIANSDYARSKRALLSLVKEIRSSGAQLDIDLPRIAVVGKQSAGKSSLIEAISAVCAILSELHVQPRGVDANQPPTLTDQSTSRLRDVYQVSNGGAIAELQQSVEMSGLTSIRNGRAWKCLTQRQRNSIREASS